MELNWYWGAAILGLGAFWIQLILSFRARANKMKPQGEKIKKALSEMEANTQEARQEADETRKRIEEMEKAFEVADQKRLDVIGRLDRYQMVLIPAGDCRIGSSDGPKHEQPNHHVHLDGFLIDRYPVTNVQYKQYLDITGQKTPPHWFGGTYPIEQANHPVVNVGFQEARDFAEWMGKRLPTEAEWEKAARGPDGRTYPWGVAFHKERLNSGNDPGQTTPVDKYRDGGSQYGVMDMCGNVSEWTVDWYDEEYYKESPSSNPEGPETGKFKVIKGGFFGETIMGVRAACRAFYPPANGRDNLGFRCAKTPGEKPPKPQDKEKSSSQPEKRE